MKTTEKEYNVFNLIRNQIIQNEVFGKENIFTVTGEYPERAIVWLVKNKVFKIIEIQKSINEKGLFEYQIKYSDVFTLSDFLERAYEDLKYKVEMQERRGYFSNEPVTVKMLNINDKYRYELECNNWNNEADENGYRQCTDNSKGFEHLTPEDNCCLELILNNMGYKSYEEFAQEYMQMYYGRKIKHNELKKYYPNSADSIPIEIREVLSMEIENFYRYKVKDCETV